MLVLENALLGVMSAGLWAWQSKMAATWAKSLIAKPENPGRGSEGISFDY